MHCFFNLLVASTTQNPHHNTHLLLQPIVGVVREGATALGVHVELAVVVVQARESVGSVKSVAGEVRGEGAVLACLCVLCVCVGATLMSAHSSLLDDLGLKRRANTV